MTYPEFEDLLPGGSLLIVYPDGREYLAEITYSTGMMAGRAWVETGPSVEWCPDGVSDLT